MIWLIGHYSYSYSPYHRVRVRVPLRCVRVRFWAELEQPFSDDLQLVLPSRLIQFIPNGRPYDDLLKTLHLLGVLGVLAVPLMGPAPAR